MGFQAFFFAAQSHFGPFWEGKASFRNFFIDFS